MSPKTLTIIHNLLDRYPALSLMEQNLIESIEILSSCFAQEGKLLVCGNGGSAADSLHIVGELMKSFANKRSITPSLQSKLKELFPEEANYYISNLEGALPAISLVNEVSLMTAFGNDRENDLSFAQQVLGLGKEGDILFCISTSGNSPNVIHAAKIAKVMGMTVISLTGESGGKLEDISDLCLAVPATITHHVQEYHLPIYHCICLALEEEFFGGN